MNHKTFTLKGQLVDVHQRRIYPAEVVVENQKISRITELPLAPDLFIMPGLVDAHVHIESSMLAPTEFAPLALAQGTLATVSDPHEIANVLGAEGVRWMAENGKKAPFYFHFGAPSCVPATTFETAGAEVTVAEIRELLEDGTCHYLAEMMNWPGVLFGNEEVAAKIKVAKELGKPVDGHAPGLRGEQAKAYFAAGIETDHECFTLEEARDKAALGVKILIREGSAARNFEALIPIMKEYPAQVMFCSDDKHPDDLLVGHINQLVCRALKLGYDRFDVLRAATVHPMNHYKLPCGQLRVGDLADFMVFDGFENMTVLATYFNGEKVFDREGVSWKPQPITDTPNAFYSYYPDEIAYQVASNASGKTQVRVIEAIEGQLITQQKEEWLLVQNGQILPDPERDILKLTVVNRYKEAPPAIAFITGFGLKEAAIASSVAHDSHNIVAVGIGDGLIKKAVDAVMNAKGGVALAFADGVEVLPLPIAGLMSDQTGAFAGAHYEQLTFLARQYGSTPKAPFMLLSFMALLVIPFLKLSDLGLFHGGDFRFVDLEMSTR